MKRQDAGTCSVVAAGDFCPIWSDEAVRLILEGKSGDILSGARNVLDAADFRIIQFETVLTDANTPIPKSGPALKSPPGVVEFVKAGKFDAALLANNHTGDYGEKALLNTLDILKRNGIHTAGAGKNAEEAYLPLFLEKDGFRLAVLNQCEHEFGYAWGSHAGSAGLNFEILHGMISSAKKNADAVFVILHGGQERNPFPSPGMRERLRRVADCGADAVMNIHPHCPQGIEQYHGVPIVYSPGNFYFPKNGTAAIAWCTGYLPTFIFTRGGGASVKFDAYRFTAEAVSILSGDEDRNFRKYMDFLSAPIGDRAELDAWFEAWAALTGPEHCARILNSHLPESTDPDSWTPAVLAGMLGFRNSFCCEAHDETIAAYLRKFERHIPEDTSRMEMIKKLQNLEIP